MPDAYARTSLVSGIWSVRLSSWAYCLAHNSPKRAWALPRQRITTCTDLAVLDVWFERAITAPTADAVFDES
ncbi:hypothetical protein AB0N95_18615 [Streptomyces microflavus]|uniref:hypothetical protein n=1 Tax=Streptomyces microflavus TaxID=1919 RepID=UPI0034285171